MPRGHGSNVERRTDPHRAVVLALLVTTALGGAAALAAAIAVGNPVLADAALAAWIGAGVLLGVGGARGTRSRVRPPPDRPTEAPTPESLPPAEPVDLALVDV